MKNAHAVVDFLAAIPPDRWLLLIAFGALGVVAYALHINWKVVDTMTKKERR